MCKGQAARKCGDSSVAKVGLAAQAHRDCAGRSSIEQPLRAFTGNARARGVCAMGAPTRKPPGNRGILHARLRGREHRRMGDASSEEPSGRDGAELPGGPAWASLALVARIDGAHSWACAVALPRERSAGTAGPARRRAGAASPAHGSPPGTRLRATGRSPTDCGRRTTGALKDERRREIRSWTGAGTVNAHAEKTPARTWETRVTEAVHTSPTNV
jgi:hypothetical protein